MKFRLPPRHFRGRPAAFRHLPAGTAAAVLLAVLGLAPSARAKFLNPSDAVREPELQPAVEILKNAKTADEAEPAFETAVRLAGESGAGASAGERHFLLGYLYQYGIGTAPDAAKAREAYQKSADAGFAPAKNNLGLLLLAAGLDPAAGLSMVEELANTGHAAAQTSMGQLYLDGAPAAGIARDPEKARVWLERGSAGGDADATWTLALLLSSQPNLSTAQATEALSLMEKAVAAGHLPALIDYGTRLVTGQGPQPDPARGLKLLSDAAGKGSGQALMALGLLYENGTGVPRDEKKAFDYYTQAAARNETSAFSKLGFFHENGMGVKKDEKKALEYYQKGADLNYGPCLYNLGVFHDEGRAGLKKDAAAAFGLHYRAAMSGFVPSQLALGTRYRDGKGTVPDAQAALAWYQRAMMNGDVTGALNVATILESGGTGVVDNETAAKIYKDAAGKGNALAMASLGAMIEDGRGVQGDFKQVYLLYSAGAEAKIPAARERLANFRKRLSADQIKEAEAFVKASQPASPGSGAAGGGEVRETPAPAAGGPGSRKAGSKPPRSGSGNNR